MIRGVTGIGNITKTREIGLFCLHNFNDVIDGYQRSAEIASGMVRAAISQLFDEASSFTYMERGKTIADLCRKIMEIVIQESNIELLCQELLTVKSSPISVV